MCLKTEKEDKAPFKGCVRNIFFKATSRDTFGIRNELWTRIFNQKSFPLKLDPFSIFFSALEKLS
jgi:hypothetical protein